MAKNYAQELEDLLLTVARENASDLHLAGGRVPFLRVHGELIPLVQKGMLTNDDLLSLLRIFVPEERINELRALEEIDFAYDFPQGNLRLRGNAYIQAGRISIALRSLQEIKTVEDLGLPVAIKEFTKRKQGFFLIVGPVGVGKSTTLAALVDLINTERKEHIVTIENPIEYIFKEKNSIIDQREVGTDTKSFSAALEAAFREDINVIMVGEMRSAETISIAATAAETGHLVLSTLHTNNAAQTVDRIIDSFPATQQGQIRTQLAGSLIGIFSQRLIPAIQGGLVPAYELMINNNAVSTLIREGRTQELDNVIETGFEHGMIDMNRSLMELVRAGKITVEDALRYSFNPSVLESSLKR